MKNSRIIYLNAQDAVVELGDDFGDFLKDAAFLGARTFRSLGFKLLMGKEWMSKSAEVLRSRLFDIITVLRDRHVLVDFDGLRRQSVKYGILLIGPRDLQLNIIQECNYRCLYCSRHNPYVRHPVLPQERRVSSAALKSVIDDAYSMGVESVVFCGKGEPLLYRGITCLIGYALSKGFLVGVPTNAVFADCLFKLPPTPRLSLIINLSAINKTRHGLIHGGPVIDFCTHLSRIKKLSARFRVRLSFIITKQNYRDIEKFLRVACSVNVNDVIFKFADTAIKKQQEELLLSQEEAAYLYSQLCKIKTSSHEFGIKTNIGHIESLLKKSRTAAPHKDSRIKCFNPWFFCKISFINGNRIYDCCRSEDEAVSILQKTGFRHSFFSKNALRAAFEKSRGINQTSKIWKLCNTCSNTRTEAVDV